MKNRRKRGSDGTKSKMNWKDPIYREKNLKSRKLTNIKKNLPHSLLEETINMTEDEILIKFSNYSKKLYTKLSNTQLSNRIEVSIIKEYKRQNRIRNDYLTTKGWYRLSTEKLKIILIEYSKKYGMLKEYENQIKDIINEAN